MAVEHTTEAYIVVDNCGTQKMVSEWIDDDFYVCLQFAVVLNDKKAKIRHLKAQCMEVFVTF